MSDTADALVGVKPGAMPASAPAHTIDIDDDGQFTLDGAPTRVRPGIRGVRIACHIVTWRAFERLRELQRAGG